MTQPDFADVNLLPTKNGLDFGVHYSPGSIDNAIVRLAWGIGMHFLLSRYPPASLENLENLDREVQSYGMALVSDFLEGQEELAKLASSQKE
jgi:hypothetical protein